MVIGLVQAPKGNSEGCLGQPVTDWRTPPRGPGCGAHRWHATSPCVRDSFAGETSRAGASPKAFPNARRASGCGESQALRSRCRLQTNGQGSANLRALWPTG
ncbi:hypothetical protein HRbin30_00835 [bacterium HR30]|nr:hypothetical protein HRbin30_00835 [bacterium HR30]